MRYITMHDSEHSHTARYVTLAVIIIVVASMLFPLVEGLGAAGFFGEKTYLIILQDNSEIRGTGGLITLMGVLTMRDGRIAKLQYYYSHTSGTPLKANVSLNGPESFTTFFNVDEAWLFDSNVQYDFASFAPKVQSDWYSVTGQKLDGVIGLDFTAAEAILSITGPLTASGEVITNMNLYHRLEFYASGQNGTQMVNFLSTLTYGTLALITDASVPQKLTLYKTFQDLANEKHLFVYPNQGLLLGSAGDTSRAQSDFVSVVDVNLGNGKSDFGINRTIDYHVQLLPDGSTVSNLTLTYSNGDWWASDLFAQALVPPGAKLTAVYNSTRRFDGPEITNDENFTAFSSRFDVSPYSTARITYLYTLPDRVYGNGVGSHYDLYVVKQGGIDRYTLNTSVQLPAGATLIHAENVGSNLVFTDDAHVSVVYM